MRATTAATTLAVLVFAVAGCSSVAERATESAVSAMSDGEADLDLDEGGFTVEGEDGERLSLGATSEVPAEIADVVPIPDGFQPVSSLDTTDNGQHGTTVAGTVEGGDPPGLVDDLEEQLTADGWERASHSNSNDQLVSLSLTRGEEALNVSVISDGDEAMVTLILTRPA